MFPKLLKLIIKSRFSWTYFLIIFIFLVYAGTAVISSRAPTGADFGDYYFAGMLALFSLISILMGGLSMTKSDSEFLLVSPVNRRTLSSTLYVGQYLYTGPIIFVAFIVYTLTAPYSASDKIILFIDDILLSTLPVSLSVTSANLNIRLRIIAGIVFALWVFSFRLGFQYSPISMFNGHLYDAVIPSMILSIVLIAGSLSMLSSEKLAFKVMDRRIGKSEYKHIKSYTGLSPARAIFQYGFTRFEIATRSNFSGTPTLSGRRVRANLVVIVFMIGAIIYGYAAYRFNPPSNDPFSFNIVTLFAGLYIGAFPPLIMSGSTMPMERAWLSFTSMKPSKYLPLLVLAKMAQMTFLMASFIVVDIALLFLGVGSALNNLILFLVIDPLFLAFFMAINYRVQSYQIKDEKLITSRYSAGQFILIPPMLIFLGIAGITSIFLFSALIIIPIIAVLAFAILMWKGFWDRRIYRLVEKGFI